jgi:alkanesulfonate monooxygenase SsuD/methylene tetrahydromethanopterin reductase-like flavin-dependent oxidoreductase (luciferase family)
MKLGLLLGFWGEDGPPPRLLETVREAETLGYESVWTSEASGSDALTPLAWVGAHTATMRLGTSIMHMAARAPAATAMAALSLDYYSPYRDAHYRAALAEGAARPGARAAEADFEIVATVPLIVDEDVETAAGRLRGLFARFIGGMGPRGRNFHYDAFARMGYEEVATRVRDLWLEGRAQESAAAVPTAMIEQVALIGPAPKIRDELVEWRRSLLTTLLVHVTPEPAVLRQVAELVLGG